MRLVGAALSLLLAVSLATAESAKQDAAKKDTTKKDDALKKAGLESSKKGRASFFDRFRFRRSPD